MKILLKQNTESFIGSKNYDVFLDKKRIFLIQKSIIPFTTKYIIREAKNKIKVGEFEGKPGNKKYGALITARRTEIQVTRSNDRSYKSEWLDNTERSHRIEGTSENWAVVKDNKEIADWSYMSITKFGKNQITINLEQDADILVIIAYAALFDIHRIRISIGWSSPSD